MRKLSPIILALALSPLVQAESVSEVSPVGKIDGMVSLLNHGYESGRKQWPYCFHVRQW